MKKLALAIAFVLLAAVPSSAAEISAEIFQAVPAMTPAVTPINQTQEAIPLVIGPIQPIPRCYTMAGYSCPTAGVVKACTDACQNNLSCTCQNFYGGTYGTTFLGRYWVCRIEC